MKPISLPWLAGVLSAWSIAAGAQTPEPVSPPATTTTTTTTSTPVKTLGGGGSPAETRIVNSFSAWAGSEDNARSLVTGLRQGSEITLTTPTSSGLPGSGTPGTGAGTTGTASSGGISFTPPTRPMGYGNVRIALSLAREQLAQSGITQPTPAQLEAALMGGTTTTGTATGTGGAATTTASFPGVLQMRADGMGWGRIANSMGVKLGHVMSGRTSLPPPAVPPADPSGTASTGGGSSTGATTSTQSGVSTAAGSTPTTVSTRSRGNSAAAHQAHRPGAGIVTAAGGSTAALSAGATANGGGNSTGVVTAAGVASGSRASASGRAHGKGHANP